MDKLLQWIDKILYYFVGAAFIVIFIVNIVQIILRSFTSYSLLWSVDFSQMLFVWIVALGAVVALFRNEHLLIGYIKEKFPKKVELLVDLLTRLLLLAFYVMLIVTGIEIAEIRMRIAYTTLGWPTGLAYYSIPVSGVLMVIFTLNAMVKISRQFKSQGGENVKFR